MYIFNSLVSHSVFLYNMYFFSVIELVKQQGSFTHLNVSLKKQLTEVMF